jgi:hypothetical protein
MRIIFRTESRKVSIGVTAERASVQMALLDPSTDLPAIRFAMPGGNSDLWYDIGMIELE